MKVFLSFPYCALYTLSTHMQLGQARKRAKRCGARPRKSDRRERPLALLFTRLRCALQKKYLQRTRLRCALQIKKDNSFLRPVFCSRSHLNSWKFKRINNELFGLSAKPLETYRITVFRPSVCPSVRPSVTLYLRIRSIFFSEIWQLGSTPELQKNVPSGFLI